MFSIKESEDGISFSIKVLPRSSRCEIAGIQDDTLKIKITAPPVEGLANEECIRFLSKQLSISKSRIRIVSGHQSRKKIVHVSGLTKEELASRIPDIAF
jgi:hypothetical protein